MLTPLARFGAENVLAVRVDHSRFADSRWYTGSGIYRHVRLRLTDKLHIAHWGTYLVASASEGRGRRGPGGGFGRFGGEESWNWPSNAMLTVRCFTTCPEVVLFLNDRPVGTNHLTDAVQGVLNWQMSFEPGVLKAVGRKNAGTECEFRLRTAGPAHRIDLLPDTTVLSADGRDLCHVEFCIADAQGVRVPDAANELTFTITGPAKILGIENGDLNSAATGQTASAAPTVVVAWPSCNPPANRAGSA